ncbi:specifically androgen-regulated gene protein-like [Sinocyclocheilus grahami]|uniref:specifically androgen-regulated gene protein-like n=2 Tax=Sinocyclocheilus grahami TaxID=75366 RepID=UPI0007AC7D42|nr:PREDICTED: specifically androgen-regulated gene protein-like [Sinocyclocheilus grahami]
MPKSDTWPGGVSIDSLSGMDSAGSCDSVLSSNSGFSDDSLEHLSAEERACLMFLEETIESLEVEDDSGLSNDEPDRPTNGMKDKTAQRTSIYQNKSDELSAHEDPNKAIGRDCKPSQKYLVPTPLLLASGNAKIVSKPMESSPKEAPVAFIDAPDGFRSSPDLQQPGRTVSEEAASKVAPAKPRIGLSSDVVDLPPSFTPEPPVRTSLPSESKTKDGVPKSLDVKSPLKQKKDSSEVPLEFIPPPSDFMDEPAEKISLSYSPPPPPVYDKPPEWIPQLPKMEPHVSGGSVKPTEATKSVSADPDTSSEPLSHNEVENLRKKVSMKKAPHLTPLMVAHHSAADKPMTPSPSSEHVPKEYSDPKSPPAVAPKPKKLPSNIIIKSHKDPGTTHSLLSQTERAQMDPQKIRMEALKKLGLLKNEEVETGHGVSPSHSPTFRAKKPQSLCNPTEPFQELSRLSESPVPGDVQLLADTLKHQDAKSREGSLKKQPTKSYEIKTASLERTRSRTAADPAPQTTNPDRTQVELSPGQLRKSRDRPSSVGSTKDFGIGHHANDSTKSLNAAAVQPGSDGQKLPRSGISVMISPHGNNGENRREALKKLGLLRD